MQIGFWNENNLPKETETIADEIFINKLSYIMNTIKQTWNTKTELNLNALYKSPFVNSNMIGFMGVSFCKLCSKPNGFLEFKLESSYTFPEGLLHYYQDHNVVPDENFLNYIKKFQLLEMNHKDYENLCKSAQNMNILNLMSGSCNMIFQ